MIMPGSQIGVRWRMATAIDVVGPTDCDRLAQAWDRRTRRDGSRDRHLVRSVPRDTRAVGGIHRRDHQITRRPAARSVESRFPVTDSALLRRRWGESGQRTNELQQLSRRNGSLASHTRDSSEFRNVTETAPCG